MSVKNSVWRNFIWLSSFLGRLVSFLCVGTFDSLGKVRNMLGKKYAILFYIKFLQWNSTGIILLLVSPWGRLLIILFLSLVFVLLGFEKGLFPEKLAKSCCCKKTEKTGTGVNNINCCNSLTQNSRFCVKLLSSYCLQAESQKPKW